MWTRKDLKEKAKAALKRNYWKAVLVSLLLIMLGEGLMPAAAAGGRSGDEQEQLELETAAENGMVIYDVKENGTVLYAVDERLEELQEELRQVDESALEAYKIVFIMVILIIVIVILIVVILADVFITNPLCVGAQRFMLKSVDGMGNVAELGFAFDHNYKNAVKTMFFRELHIFLWGLLFFIPAIYKIYQYYMVEYILAENPNMPYKEVLERSKKMMEGQKWNAFVLDLSFILWHVLGTVTCGIAEILYIKPYVKLTRASLYRALTSDMEQS